MLMNNLTIPLLYVLAGLLIFGINFGKKVFSKSEKSKPMEEWTEEEKKNFWKEKGSGKTLVGPLIDFSKWGSKDEK